MAAAPFGLEAGEWTDDTSLALCLAESLGEKRGFGPVDQLERLLPLVYGGASLQHRDMV